MINEQSKNNDPIFDQVLFIGPDLEGYGGIASVLKSYSQSIERFHYLPTYSAKGKLSGWIRLIASMCQMPMERVKGRRIAHIHYASGRSWMRKRIIFSWAKMLGFKTVLHCHTGRIFNDINKMGPTKFGNILNSASWNLVLSKSWMKKFTDIIRIDNISIVNNIVNPVTDQINEKKGSIGTSQFKIVYIGVPDKNKAVDVLLKAIKKSIDRGCSVHLDLCGNGPEIDNLKQLSSELGISDNVTFVGWVDSEEKHKRLSTASLLALTSHAEGLPICILEAMAEGLPILATNVGGIPDVVQTGINGTLCPDGDITGIADAIEFYYNNPSELEKQGKKSLEIVKDYYPENVTNQLATLYKHLLSK